MPRTQNTPPRPRRRPSLLFAIAATILLLTVGVATAAATSTIEGVWSFGGGQIAIQPEGNGKFEGVVVSPTTFASCVHPVGQKIWKELTPQADGSYWGFHQWYKATQSESCSLNPTLGPTAWRVVEEAGGGHYLRVCLNSPGPGAKQPTIPPGSPGVTTYKCYSSTLIAPLPVVSTGTGTGTSGTTPGKSGAEAFKETLSLPSTKQCLSGRYFKIHLQDPKFDPFKTVLITIKGKKIKTVRKGKFVDATINLRGYPRGKFTIKISVKTTLGHHLSATRTYHTCAKKRKISHPKKLK